LRLPIHIRVVVVNIDQKMIDVDGSLYIPSIFHIKRKAQKEDPHRK
jgi:hypothetical protein